MAEREHVAVVRQGARALFTWQQAHPGVSLNLSNADLSKADLSHANLSGANLASANLVAANLAQADLQRAWLFDANLLLADLSEASLMGANLQYANLNGSLLHGADFSQVTLGATVLGHLNLSGVIGLRTVTHQYSSSVGVDTLIESFHGAGRKFTPELETFFLGAGVPKELLDALPGIVAKVQYYSCFISYGQPDLEFATKLYEDLQARGVSCWLYGMDAKVGEPTWREIDHKLEEYEKMIVLCSIDALMREGVKKEIDKQIDRSPDKLVPISLENRWTQQGFTATWGHRDLKLFLMERNYADLQKSGYQGLLERLLKGLERPSLQRER